VATLAAALVERGDLEGARAELAQLDGTYDPEVMPSQIIRESRAKLCIAEGHPAAALDELLAALAAETRSPAAAQTALGEQRVAFVRDALVGRGVDGARLVAQSAPAAVEGEGTGRVEFEITP
jgi:hypothetical protein